MLTPLADALVVIEKAGHLLWLDQPDALAAELLRHLEAREVKPDRCRQGAVAVPRIPPDRPARSRLATGVATHYAVRRGQPNEANRANGK
jgi:hypothetical protein